MTEPSVTLLPVRNQQDVLDFEAMSEAWHQQAPPSRREYLTIGPEPHRAGQHLSRDGFVDVLTTLAEYGNDAFVTVSREKESLTCILNVEPGKAHGLNLGQGHSGRKPRRRGDRRQNSATPASPPATDQKAEPISKPKPTPMQQDTMGLQS